jgi:hypothetical protein
MLQMPWQLLLGLIKGGFNFVFFFSDRETCVRVFVEFTPVAKCVE